MHRSEFFPDDAEDIPHERMPWTPGRSQRSHRADRWPREEAELPGSTLSSKTISSACEDAAPLFLCQNVTSEVRKFSVVEDLSKGVVDADCQTDVRSSKDDGSPTVSQGENPVSELVKARVTVPEIADRIRDTSAGLTKKMPILSLADILPSPTFEGVVDICFPCEGA